MGNRRCPARKPRPAIVSRSVEDATLSPRPQASSRAVGSRTVKGPGRARHGKQSCPRGPSHRNDRRPTRASTCVEPGPHFQALKRLELRPVRNALVMPDPLLHKSLPRGYPHGSSGHGSAACELGRMSDKLPVSCPSPHEAKARNAEALTVPVDRERDKISLTRCHCRPMSGE